MPPGTPAILRRLRTERARGSSYVDEMSLLVRTLRLELYARYLNTSRVALSTGSHASEDFEIVLTAVNQQVNLSFQPSVRDFPAN